MDNMEIYSSVLEEALRRTYRAVPVKRILSIEGAPAAGEGQNCLSTVKRLHVKALLENGQKVYRSFILKDSNVQQEYFKEFIKNHNVFEVEIMMYTVVLKEMEHLMKEIEDTEEILWCKILIYRPYSLILLEDLKMKGYKPVEGHYLDMNQAYLALAYLGRYHGMCKILEQRGIIQQQEFAPWFVFSRKNSYTTLHHFLMEIAKVSKNMDYSWTQLGEKIEKISLETIVDKITQIEHIANRGSGFKVLNHGDYKACNIVFKYDFKGMPYDLKFFDFQLPAYGSPCMDLTYFLYRSIRSTDRKYNSNSLLMWYYSSLIRTLEGYKFLGIIPNFVDISADLEKMSFLGHLLVLKNYFPKSCNWQPEDMLMDTEISKTKIFKDRNKETLMSEIEYDIKELTLKLNV